MMRAHTRRLTAERLELVSEARTRAWIRVALIAVLVSLAAVAGLRLLADGAARLERQASVQQQNAALRAESARLEAELQFERATRAAMDEQVTQLTQRIAELERQLAFVQARGGTARRPAPPPVTQEQPR